MDIKTLLTDEELREIAELREVGDKPDSYGWVVVNLEVIRDAQDAKTKRVMIEEIEAIKDMGYCNESCFHITDNNWQEFKKWALGE